MTYKELKLITDTLLLIVNTSEDRQWAERVCILFMENPNSDISGLAITCLGHLARIHKKTTEPLVTNTLNSILRDPVLGGRASDALDDIETYAKK